MDSGIPEATMAGVHGWKAGNLNRFRGKIQLCCTPPILHFSCLIFPLLCRIRRAPLTRQGVCLAVIHSAHVPDRAKQQENSAALDLRWNCVTFSHSSLCSLNGYITAVQWLHKMAAIWQPKWSATLLTLDNSWAGWAILSIKYIFWYFVIFRVAYMYYYQKQNYYHALVLLVRLHSFHTYNQQKIAKIWCYGSRCSGHGKFEICCDITSSKLFIQRVKGATCRQQCSMQVIFLTIMDRGLGSPPGEFLNVSLYAVFSVDKKKLFVLLLYYF